MIQRRKRFRLADGRYVVEVTPSVYDLQDAFGRSLALLPAEHIELPSTLDGNEEQCE